MKARGQPFVQLAIGLREVDVADSGLLEAELRILGENSVRPRELVEELLGLELPASRFVRSKFLIVDGESAPRDFGPGRAANAA